MDGWNTVVSFWGLAKFLVAIELLLQSNLGDPTTIDVSISKIIPRTGETNKMSHQTYNTWNHAVGTIAYVPFTGSWENDVSFSMGGTC